jgi:hypothetical protein
VSAIDPKSWRRSAAGLADPDVTAVLIVQCGLDWLRPGLGELRDEIDGTVMAALLAREDLVIHRIVLHSLPVEEDLAPGELATLIAAHDNWLYHLAVAGELFPAAWRPRVHRLIVGGSQRNVGAMDGVELRVNDTWSHPDAAAAALAILDQAGATTPLTSYDIEIDGPYGDADPSVYL